MAGVVMMMEVVQDHDNERTSIYINPTVYLANLGQQPQVIVWSMRRSPTARGTRVAERMLAMRLPQTLPEEGHRVSLEIRISWLGGKKVSGAGKRDF